MGRGQKQCEGCGASTGPRAFNCPRCGKEFEFKSKVVKSGPVNVTKAVAKPVKPPKVKRLTAVDWTTLVKDDLIKVAGGPYFVKEDGTRVVMGYRGIFRVSGLDSDGIRAYPVKAAESGMCFISMTKKTHIDVLVGRPHRIRKLTPRNKDKA